jgi:hypothetical protein
MATAGAGGEIHGLVSFTWPGGGKLPLAVHTPRGIHYIACHLCTDSRRVTIDGKVTECPNCEPLPSAEG